MNWLVWHIPFFVHDLIRRIFGKVLVRVYVNEKPPYWCWENASDWSLND